MKKLMIALCAGMMAAAANAGFCWSWWVGDENTGKSLEGCQLGIASECKEMKGAQVSLLWGRVQKVIGCQFAFGYSNVEKLFNGPQLAVVNVAREGAALQFGLLNFNKSGFLPFFPFVNVAGKYFGNPNK